MKRTFHTSFSPTIKHLETVSEEEEEEQTPHIFWNSDTQTETDRQADPHPRPGHLTPCSHSSRVSLLFSPPWSGQGCGHT